MYSWVSGDVPNMGQLESTLDGDCSITISSDALTQAQIGPVLKKFMLMVKG